VEEISEANTRTLVGKNIVLGVTGSSAAYKSVDLARALIRMGANVRVVMSEYATRLVGTDLFQWATGFKPYVEITGETEHIDLAKWGDVLVIAPATLNTMSKIAHGILDGLLPLLAVTMLGSGKRVIVVPTMNIRLMQSPQYGRAISVLREQGVVIIPPLLEEDKAKYPPVSDLAHCIDAITNRGRDLEGLKVLVTAGATREYIDPVRVLTNPSTGLMGILLAREAACRGADVVLVHGQLSVEKPYMARSVYTETTQSMAHVIGQLTSNEVFDAAIFAAAPVDYKPTVINPFKFKTRDKPRIQLELETTPKTVKCVVKRPRVVVIFAAETTSDESELINAAREKLADYGADLVVASNVLSNVGGFGKEFLDAVIVDSSGVIKKGVISKYEISRFVVDYVVEKSKKP